MEIVLVIKDEYIDILAKEYGYTDKIQEPVITEDEFGRKSAGFQELDNPLTKAQYIAKVHADRMLAQVRAHLSNLESIKATEKIKKKVKESEIQIKNK